MDIFSNTDLKSKYLLERIEAEINFASKFSELYPLHKAKWLLLIEKATKEVSDAIKSAPTDILPSAVEKAEKIMSPIGALAKKHTIHCVGHAHIDMNWMWT